MAGAFDNKAPIYMQLMDEIKMMIVSGLLKPGEKLDSVRDLAVRFGVNPNTMQRALAELEREELLHSERTAGRYITEDEVLIMGIRDTLAKDEIQRFLHYMEKIGYTKEEILEFIERQCKEVKV